MGAPRHGKNGLVYVSGNEIIGANSWSITFDKDTTETPQFGDTWKKSVGGLLGWGGSLAAWDQGDDTYLKDAATANASVAVLIYPNNSDTNSYYSGDAWFSYSGEGSTGGGVGEGVDFVGNGTLTIAGFT
jgi:hypothetical protein